MMLLAIMIQYGTENVLIYLMSDDGVYGLWMMGVDDDGYDSYILIYMFSDDGVYG